MTPPRNVSALKRALRQIALSNEDAAHLQLMFAHENIDLVEVNAICSRLFPNRQKHAWPAQLAAEGEEWRLAYDNLKGSLPVIPTLREAATWLNRQITMIAAAGSGIRE